MKTIHELECLCSTAANKANVIYATDNELTNNKQWELLRSKLKRLDSIEYKNKKKKKNNRKLFGWVLNQNIVIYCDFILIHPSLH